MDKIGRYGGYGGNREIKILKKIVHRVIWTK